MDKITFGGITTSVDKCIEDTFECIFDDYNKSIYAEKQTRHHDDDVSFNYKYLIEVLWLSQFDLDDGCLINLYLVPTADSLCENALENVCGCCGVDKNEINVMDIADYGHYVCMLSEKCEETDVRKYMNACASVVDTVDCLRGFFLDKPYNAIGTIGWDVINHVVKDDDLFAPAFERMSQKQYEKLLNS